MSLNHIVYQPGSPAELDINAVELRINGVPIGGGVTPIFDQLATINRPLSSQSAILDYTLAGLSQWTVGTRPALGPDEFGIYQGPNPRISCTSAADMTISPAANLNVLAPELSLISPTPGLPSTLRINTIFAGGADLPVVELARQGVVGWQLLSDAGDDFQLVNRLDAGGPKIAIRVDSASSAIALNDDTLVTGEMVVQSSALATPSVLRIDTSFPGGGHLPRLELARQGGVEWQVQSGPGHDFQIINLMAGLGPTTVVNINQAFSTTTLDCDAKVNGAFTFGAVAAPGPPGGTSGTLYKIAADDGLYWRTAAFGPVNLVDGTIKKKWASIFKANAVLTPTPFAGAFTFSNWVTSAGGLFLVASNDAAEWATAATPGSSVTYIGNRTFNALIHVDFGAVGSAGAPASTVRQFRLLVNGAIAVDSQTASRIANTGLNEPACSTMSCMVPLVFGHIIQPQVGSSADTISTNIYSFTISITEVGP